MKRSEHPINWKRAVIASLGVYAVCVTFSVALEVLVLIPAGVPYIVRFLTGVAIAAVGLYVVMPRYLRPWYRPAPKQEHRTEDHL